MRSRSGSGGSLGLVNRRRMSSPAVPRASEHLPGMGTPSPLALVSPRLTQSRVTGYTARDGSESLIGMRGALHERAVASESGRRKRR